MLVSLRTRLTFSHLIVAIILVSATAFLAFRSAEWAMFRQIESETLVSLHASANSIQNVNQADVTTRVAQVLAERVKGRAMVLSPLGRVQADSSEKGSLAGKVLSLDELPRVLAGESVSTVYTHEDGKQYLYAAVPVKPGDKVEGVVLVSVPLVDIARRLYRLVPRLAASALGVLAAGAILSFALGHASAWPVSRLARVLEAAQDTDYRHTLRISGRGEVPRMARVFSRMAERLRHTEQVRRDFIVEASQEIEEPLKDIIDLASDQSRAPAERLLAIRETAGSMSWAIDQLLDLARLEIDPRPLRLEQFDFSSMVNRVIDTCRADIATPGTSIHREDRLDLPVMVNGDEARLQVAFNALLRFCLATAPEGTTVGVAISEDPSNILVSVTGGKTEVEEEELPLLFERFLSRLSKGQDELVGVPAAGLNMSRRIIELHRGMIEARRSSSKRLTFFARVPKGVSRQ